MRVLVLPAAALALVTLVSVAMVDGRVAAAAPDETCLLVDTDLDIDDMMSIPMVVGARHVAAVITTGGFTQPGPGASGVEHLLEQPGQRTIPVIAGAGIARSDADIAATFGDFVLVFRSLMNRLNNSLPAELPPAAQTGDHRRRVADAVAACSRVDVLLLGPFTSFADYSPAIRQKIGRVVISGRPLRGDAELEAVESFNCAYDQSACETLFHRQLPGLDHSFVDVPRSDCDHTPNRTGCVGTVYGPSLAMVRSLGPAGPPRAVGDILLDHPESWAIDTWERSGYGGRSLFWDQSATLALLEPTAFRPVEAHLETTLSPAEFQRRWVEYTNLSATYA